MDIDDWRDEIDRVDQELVELLNRRAHCAIEIGRIKRKRGLPIYLPEREREVVQHVVTINAGPLDAEAVRRLFERIIDESRSLERVAVERENAEKDRAREKKEPSTGNKRKARNRA